MSKEFLPKVSVVIPSYRGSQLLKKNLPKVLACLRNEDEIVIVDDASGAEDPTKADLAVKYQLRKIAFEQFPAELYRGFYQENGKRITMTLLINLRNMRFAVSANRGVAISQHDFVFLLNNDVSPQADVLKYLLPHFQDEKLFAVACKEIEPAQKSISGKNRLFFAQGIFQHSRAFDFLPGETAWATGGSALFRKSMWQELKGFDERYAPAYWEDVDLSFQARKRKWRVLFEPQAVVVHNHETTNSSVFGEKKIAQMSWQNAKKFTRKNANLWQLAAYYLWQPYWWWKMKKHEKMD